jgi:hypothetical protein
MSYIVEDWLPEFPVACGHRGRPPKCEWTHYADGKIHLLIRGVDFFSHEPVSRVHKSAIHYAKIHDLKLKTQIHHEGLLVQFTEGESGEY